MKIDQSWYLKPKDKNFPSAVSAGGIVVRKVKSKIYIALLRDRKFKDYMLPKGRVEQGESLKTTAKREISEEIGLSNLTLICELGSKERLTFEKDQWRKTYYFLFVTEQENGEQNLQNGEEDYGVEWFDLDALPSFFWPEQKEIVDNNLKKIKKFVGS